MRFETGPAFSAFFLIYLSSYIPVEVPNFLRGPGYFILAWVSFSPRTWNILQRDA
jgi:hypothetical protein